MIVKKNYKYILNKLDDKKFQKLKDGLKFDEKDHSYSYIYKDQTLSDAPGDRLKAICKLMDQRGITEEEFIRKLEEDILNGYWRAFDSPSSKFGGAMKYFSNAMKMGVERRNKILASAAKKGTAIHKMVEEEIMKTGKSKYLPDHMKPIFVEQKFIDLEGLIAGTVDLIGWDTKRKKFFVLDWKSSYRTTNNKERWKYQFQLYAYRRLFMNSFTPKEFLTDKDIDCYIVYINKKTFKSTWLNLKDEIWGG